MCHRSNEDQAPDVQMKYKTSYYCDPLQGAFMINPHQERVLILSVWVPDMQACQSCSLELQKCLCSVDCGCQVRVTYPSESRNGFVQRWRIWDGYILCIYPFHHQISVGISPALPIQKLMCNEMATTEKVLLLQFGIDNLYVCRHLQGWHGQIAVLECLGRWKAITS